MSYSRKMEVEKEERNIDQMGGHPLIMTHFLKDVQKSECNLRLAFLENELASKKPSRREDSARDRGV